MKDTSRELQSTQQSLLLAPVPTLTQTSYYCNSKNPKTIAHFVSLTYAHPATRCGGPRTPLLRTERVSRSPHPLCESLLLTR